MSLRRSGVWAEEGVPVNPDVRIRGAPARRMAPSAPTSVNVSPASAPTGTVRLHLHNIGK